MPDWTAPFHTPVYTNDEFSAAKAKHIARHGYKITLPGLSDIIHIGQPAPLTEEEKYYYRKKAWWTFSEKRLDEIMEMKWKKKKRYEAMLASPTPEIVQNAGSFMTALDDAQDAISTLACIGKVAVHFAPRLLSKVFAGPVGWLLTASDVINLVMALSGMGLVPKVRKMKAHGATSSNPFSKKAKVRLAKKLAKWKPTKGDIIQALQTTDGVFGVGISLGPIVGLVQDILSGTVRTILGDRVKLASAPPSVLPQYRAAQKAIKAASVWGTVEFEAASEWDVEILMAHYLGQQVIEPVQQSWNPLETVYDIDGIEIKALQPTDPLTLEIMDEAKTPVEEFTGWPFTGEQWEGINAIAEAAGYSSPRNLRNMIERNAHEWTGFVMAGLACEASTYMLANLEGEAEVEYDYTAASKICGELLEMGISPDPNMTPGGFKRIMSYLEEAEELGLPTDFKSVYKELMERKIPLISAYAP